MGRAIATPTSTATLRSIRSLPALSPLDAAGVEVAIGLARPAELELVLSKAEWKAPACVPIPVRHLRVGLQVRVARSKRAAQCPRNKIKPEPAAPLRVRLTTTARAPADDTPIAR